MIKKLTSSVLILGIIIINFSFITPPIAMAASLTSLSDTVSNLTASTVANHVIRFTTPTGVPASGTIILTFDNGTNTGSVDYTDVDIQDDGVDVAVAATPVTTTWGVARTSSTVITLTNGSAAVAGGSVITIDIGTNATYGVTGTHQITNGTAGTTVLRVSGSFGDTGAMSTAIVSNGVVSLSAEVLASLTFTVSDNTIYFGNLKSSGSSCWAQGTDPGYVTCPTVAEAEAFNMTAATNAPTGYTISVQGPTLTSGSNTITALASATAPSIGSEQFGIRANASGGSGAVNATYGTAGQYAFTANATTAVAVATASAPSATTTYSVRYIANISPTTEAGSYTAAHTYIATGNF
ncbi:MAG: hypothetical protein UR97_C0009G0004 [Candidatus Nomurabacteria bacterium GW2011_GWE2_36_115]|nr:MAG: hypothetical protein UR97_C0009G0004 [Candidatus Nomurabacteria bacterium GW2011_GWE2_36_115]KKQ04980.1 MAG: hypothetical protein US17_C0009G0003 [Candidatus Nomurabacteria bacterium GW2011_GWF1_36_47]